MGNVIIGTAGHIDHGKTTLIKALTGIETDRLAEEKKRGITIDLGFAYFDLPSGRRAGIVDVPGHERFIKNMISGATGVDIVLLIVSADEGIMPQTTEHIDILSFLNVKNGIVVLTKADLVDEDWLELVQEEISEKLSNTFMKDAPIIPVSAISRQGIEKLTTTIDEMTMKIESRDTHLPVRMPIDRVFSITGFGTVVTGTLSEGTVNVGQDLVIYPEQLVTKVRNIQVHGTDQESAFAGQRVAINLSNIKKNEIDRGDVLAVSDTLINSYMLDVNLELLKHSNRSIDNWTRLRLYTGTKEVLCRAVLLDKETLNPGDKSYVQLRLEEPIACKYGDHFVIRFYSPMETIGGGIVLDPNASKHKRFKQEILAELDSKMQGDMGQILENTLLKYASEFLETKELMTRSNIEKEQFEIELNKLIEKGLAVQFDNKINTHRSYLDDVGEKMLIALNKFHTQYPLRKGLSKEEIRSRFFKNVKNKFYDFVLTYYLDQQMIEMMGQYIRIYGYKMDIEPKQKSIIDNIDRIYLEGKYKSPLMVEAFKSIGIDKVDDEIINYLLESGRLVKISDVVYFHETALAEAKESLIIFLEDSGSITLSEFKDLLDTSRKYTIPLLEYFDQIKVTKRDGERRLKR